MDASDFHTEYRIASSRQKTGQFSNILSQHAVIMVDAARPDLTKIDCIKLGGRLGIVQDDWINLLCRGINNSSQSDLDKDYRRVVAKIVGKFTDNLMDMLMEDKYVTYKELASAGEFHSRVNYSAERPLKETASKFVSYVNSLYSVYRAKNENAYHRYATDCLAIGHALGVWLDATIFE